MANVAQSQPAASVLNLRNCDPPNPKLQRGIAILPFASVSRNSSPANFAQLTHRFYTFFATELAQQACDSHPTVSILHHEGSMSCIETNQPLTSRPGQASSDLTVLQ